MKTMPYLVLSALLFSGCASELYPVLGNVVDGTPQVVANVADASVSKESVVHTTLQNRDVQYRKAYDKSGLKLTWQPYVMEFKLPGMTDSYKVTQMLPEIEFREAPKFDQPLPTAPSEHPGWRFANNFVDKGLWGFLGYQLGETLRGAKDRYTYNGPYAPNYQNPINSGNGTMTFTPGMLNRDGGYRTYETPVFSPLPVEEVAPAAETPAAQ